MLTASFQPRVTSNIPPAAASRFRGFNTTTEGPHVVRPALVTSDERQRLHDVRTMLRSMTPEQAYHAIEWVHAKLTLVQAVAFAKKTGRLIVPHSVIDRILAETSYTIPNIRTGTLIIYEKPDKPFGAKVVYENIEFSVPVQFRGKRNRALVVQYPDFVLLPLVGESYRLVVPDENSLHLIEQFPKKMAGICQKMSLVFRMVQRMNIPRAHGTYGV